MASIIRKPRSKYWFACFRDLQGRQRRKSTKQADRKKALRVAEQYEQVSQRKLPVQTVRETLVELFREAYGESVPRATVREFIATWLKNKAPEVAPATLDFYRKSTTKFLQFLGPAAELDLANVTRPMIVEFRNGLAQKVSAKTANHDLRAIKALFRSAKRDGYIIEDPAEFVESVRKTGDEGCWYPRSCRHGAGRTRTQSYERSLHACRHRSFGKGCRRFATNLMTRLLKLGICV
jgi:hypothetical protein